MLSTHHKQAFTLIELLVTTAIMLITFTSALVAYSRFTEKQRVTAVAESLESAIKEVQNRAKTGYLATCEQLVSNDIEVWLDSGQLRYQITTSCADPANDSQEELVMIDEDLTLTQDFELQFIPYGGVNIHQRGLSATLDQLASSLSSPQRADYSVDFVFDRGGGIRVTY